MNLQKEKYKDKTRSSFIYWWQNNPPHRRRFPCGFRFPLALYLKIRIVQLLRMSAFQPRQHAAMFSERRVRFCRVLSDCTRFSPSGFSGGLFILVFLFGPTARQSCIAATWSLATDLLAHGCATEKSPLTWCRDLVNTVFQHLVTVVEEAKWKVHVTDVNWLHIDPWHTSGMSLSAEEAALISWSVSESAWLAKFVQAKQGWRNEISVK